MWVKLGKVIHWMCNNLGASEFKHHFKATGLEKAIGSIWCKRIQMISLIKDVTAFDIRCFTPVTRHSITIFQLCSCFVNFCSVFQSAFSVHITTVVMLHARLASSHLFECMQLSISCDLVHRFIWFRMTRYADDWFSPIIHRRQVANIQPAVILELRATTNLESFIKLR